MVQCEVCGNPIRSQSVTVLIDGAIFRVCPPCSKLGKPVTAQETDSSITTSKEKPHDKSQPSYPPDAEVELRSDYSKEVKQAREKAGLSQEEIGAKLNEKLSVIRHIETGKLTPNDALARKIEHFLKFRLLLPAEEE